MNILSVHRGSDTGGQSARMKHAFDRLTDWNFRYATSRDAFAYREYPQDLLYRPRALRELWDEADVVHLHNDFGVADEFVHDKPAIIHYHGTAFRADPFSRLRQQRIRGVQGIVSTLDLWLLAPDELEWLPAPYDLAWLAEQ